MFGTSTSSITGNDTLIINGRNLINLADGDNVSLTRPQESSSVKTGKNGNTLYAFNTTGQQGVMSVRVVRGSADDAFLNGLVKRWAIDPATFTLMQGVFIKRVGDGTGFVRSDTHVLEGGVPSKETESKSNAEGDTEQSVTVYEFKWGKVTRAVL